MKKISCLHHRAIYLVFWWQEDLHHYDPHNHTSQFSYVHYKLRIFTLPSWAQKRSSFHWLSTNHLSENMGTLPSTHRTSCVLFIGSTDERMAKHYPRRLQNISLFCIPKSSDTQRWLSNTQKLRRKEQPGLYSRFKTNLSLHRKGSCLTGVGSNNKLQLHRVNTLKLTVTVCMHCRT